MVRHAAALPADLSSQIDDPHLPVRGIAECDQYVIVGQRQAAIRLELAIRLVTHSKLHPYVGEPGALLRRVEPTRLGWLLRRPGGRHGAFLTVAALSELNAYGDAD